jgi:hypothetical protein
MPAAFYAISFKATASVVAFCSLEKQAPADRAAWDKLRDALVGDALPIGFSAQSPLRLPFTTLAVDLITDPPPRGVISDPYAYQVSSVEAEVVPGDGKEKVLKAASSNGVAGPIAIDKVSKLVTVTLNVPPPPTVAAWLLFEGLEPISATSIAGLTVTFQLPGGVALGAKADVLLLMDGVSTTYQSVMPT